MIPSFYDLIARRGYVWGIVFVLLAARYHPLARAPTTVLQFRPDLTLLLANLSFSAQRPYLLYSAV